MNMIAGKFLRTSAARPSLVAVLLNLDNVLWIEQVLSSDKKEEAHQTNVYFRDGQALQIWESFKDVEKYFAECQELVK